MAKRSPFKSQSLNHATPQSLGFATGISDRIDHGVRAGLLPGLHSVVVMRHGKLAFERYYAGTDTDWGRPLGLVAHEAGTLHDLRSVTKSVVSLLYGIALGRGDVPPVSAPLVKQFPQYPDLASDPKRARVTIEHALTMTLGMEWNENVPYTDANNSEIQMENAPDRLRFILERPIVHEPGTLWTYSGGATALLAAIIEQGTGQALADFARDALFAPLGIEQFEWHKGADGAHSAASGLRLTARDLARIGQLALDNGEVNGRQVVPRSWIDAAAKRRISTDDGLQYGYQFWLGDAPVKAMGWTEQAWIGGFGNGGQRLFVMPATGIVMAAFFGNYDQMNNWMFPGRIWWEIVLPGLERL